MTELNISISNRGRSYNPETFLGGLPLPMSEASKKRWAMATPTYPNFRPSGYSTQKPKVTKLDESLFNALASFKQTTASLAVTHFSREDRARLFRQLDSLFDIEGWDSSDIITSRESFTTLLRLVLFLKGCRPGLGVTSSGNFIATWTEGNSRLTIECKPADHIRWVFVQDLDGQRESAAGETSTVRLPQILEPYDSPKHWFPDASHQTTA